MPKPFQCLIALVVLFGIGGKKTGDSGIGSVKFLRKCQCIQGIPDCDFVSLPKKELKTVVRKLQLFDIECDAEGIPNINGKYFQRLNSETQSSILIDAPMTSNTNSCWLHDNSTCSSPDSGVMHYFSTPILMRNIVTDEKSRKYNNDIKKIMLDLEAEDDGCKFRLHGGYRSKDGFFSRTEPSIKWLRKEVSLHVENMFDKMNSSDVSFEWDGWGAVLRGGDNQNLHVHPASIYAGVYYVAVPKEIGSHKDAGCLQFHDPRSGVFMTQDLRPKFVEHVYGLSTYTICPKPEGGLLLLFPSWLLHEVKPMLESFKGPRIGLSFNVDLNRNQIDIV
jgi:uncharacterized protein (TIGR02466 family)